MPPGNAKIKRPIFQRHHRYWDPASIGNKRTTLLLLAKDPYGRTLSLDKNPMSTTYIDCNHKPIKLYGTFEKKLIINRTAGNLTVQNF